MSDVNAVIKHIHEITAKKGKPGLRNMRRLLELLGSPEKNLRIIHVAGTNGKGSVTHFIYSMLKSNGCKAGIYTSPHVMAYNERYEFNGSYIEDEEFCELAELVFERAEQLNSEGYGYPSEFEILTVVAFLFFSRRDPDFVILEVGLGGKWDQTNVVKNPLITVITSISFDHMLCLGNTLEKIAEEKAGIIKENVPVISESIEESVKNVIRAKAAEKNAEFIDTSLYKYNIESTNYETVFSVNIGGRNYKHLLISLLGEHQVRNAIAALTAVLKLEENNVLQLKETDLRKGLQTAENIGRFELLQKAPLVVIDGAHNKDGARVSVEAINTYFGADSKTLVVLGFLSDKDYDSMINYFMTVTNNFIVTQPVSERSLPAEDLGKEIRSRGGSCTVIADIEEAYEEAVKMSSDYDLVFFAGSIYLIGDIRKIFQKKGWK